MDMKERIKEARKKLAGVKITVVRSENRQKHDSRRRKMSSFIKMNDRGDVPLKERYRQCLKKARYRSEHEARLFANRGENKRGVRLRVYECPICGGWHITKRTESR